MLDVIKARYLLPYFSAETSNVVIAVVGAAVLSLAIKSLTSPRSKSAGHGDREPPSLRGTIPILSNTLQFMLHTGDFFDRVM
jgi:hypothetical protein